MAKKGKKVKITGTPAVVRFKTDQETKQLYSMIQKIGNALFLPYVQFDPINALSERAIRSFYAMASELADWVGVPANKGYRTLLQHPLVEPEPRLYPRGYDHSAILRAKSAHEEAEAGNAPVWKLAGEEHKIPPTVVAAAEPFLARCDQFQDKLQQFLAAALKADFPDGIDGFQEKLASEHILPFDAAWRQFERLYLEELRRATDAAFAPLTRAFESEKALAKIEAENAAARREAELAWLDAVRVVITRVVPESAEASVPAEVSSVPLLAEACLFYAARLPEAYANAARVLITSYFELRHYILHLAETKLPAEPSDAPEFVRLLSNFHQASLDAVEALQAASLLPKLEWVKTDTWMTRQLMIGQ